jgi:uncharacterized Zn finger protein (UPF0148 family)
MYSCQKCGTLCQDSDLFCPGCGADLRAQKAEQPSEMNQPQPSPSAQEWTNPQPQQWVSPQPQQYENAARQEDYPGVQQPDFTQATYAQGNVNSVSEKPKKYGLGIASLILGILSVVLCCVFFVGIPCALAAIILGIIQLIKNQPKGLAIAGIILGGIGLFLGVILVIAAATNGVTFTWNGEEYIWRI